MFHRNVKNGILLSLFQDILLHTQKAGLDTADLKKAVAVMCIVPKAANDMMQVGRLQGFDVSYISISIIRLKKNLS